MKRMLLLLLAVPLLGCPEPGETLDPTLDAIQEAVFGKSCHFTTCHGGDNAQSSLRLDNKQDSFDTLINVDGLDASLVRVVPGDAEASLLYTSLLESVEDVDLMPKSADGLDQYKIDAIKQWIDDGAEF
jgi:hypothetical protein